MKEFIEKLIGRLEELPTKAITRYKGGAFGDYEGTDHFIDKYKTKDIINQLAEEYKPCHKPCTDCEEYDLVRHHCPKFCKMIKETVKEIEENHNGWIPCSERLPEIFEESMTSDIVLVLGYDKDTDFYWRAMGWYAEEAKQWFFADCRNTDKPIEWIDIIAWQPLPEPYQPKGE